MKRRKNSRWLALGSTPDCAMIGKSANNHGDDCDRDRGDDDDDDDDDDRYFYTC